MTPDLLAAFVFSPDVLRRILGEYRGVFWLRVASVGSGLEVRIDVQDTPLSFPNEIEVQGRAYPLRVFRVLPPVAGGTAGADREA